VKNIAGIMGVGGPVERAVAALEQAGFAPSSITVAPVVRLPWLAAHMHGEQWRRPRSPAVVALLICGVAAAAGAIGMTIGRRRAWAPPAPAPAPGPAPAPAPEAKDEAVDPFVTACTPSAIVRIENTLVARAAVGMDVGAAIAMATGTAIAMATGTAIAMAIGTAISLAIGKAFGPGVAAWMRLPARLRGGQRLLVVRTADEHAARAVGVLVDAGVAPLRITCAAPSRSAHRDLRPSRPPPIATSVHRDLRPA
jgi:hypothetical protein